MSHYFNAGASCFEHAEDFCRYFELLSQYGDKLYISHIIYAMLLDKLTFRPLPVTDFYDWGNNGLYKTILIHYERINYRSSRIYWLSVDTSSLERRC